MSFYCYKDGGRVFGPYTPTELARTRKIKPTTLLREIGTEDWSQASSYTEVMDALETTPPPVSDDDSVSEVELRLYETIDGKESENSDIDNTMIFSHWYSFNGRSRRTEYWAINAVISLLAPSIINLFDTNVIVGVILTAVLVYFSGAVLVRRCHDINVSGWYALIPFFAVVAALKDSYDLCNRYGNCPKQKQFKRLY